MKMSEVLSINITIISRESCVLDTRKKGQFHKMECSLNKNEKKKLSTIESQHQHQQSNTHIWMDSWIEYNE